MKNEFKIPNQEAGTSAESATHSLCNIQITIPQMMTKLVPKNKLEREYFENVCLNKSVRTQVIIIIGTTVKSVLKILKVEAPVPVSTRSV